MLFYCFLFGLYIIGTLAAGQTQSVVRMLGWGIVALLPLTLFLVFATLFVGGRRADDSVGSQYVGRGSGSAYRCECPESACALERKMRWVKERADT